MFATGQQTIVEDLFDGDLAQLHTGTVALGIRQVLCTPLRLIRYVERADQKGAEEIIGVLYLDSRERGALRSASAHAALDTLSAEAALAIENARLYREALDKAKFEQELKVAAAIQQSLLPVAAPRRRVLLHRRGVARVPRRRAATSTTTSICPPASSASSSATSPARDRRRRCWRPRCSACSAPKRPISPAPRRW